MSNNGTFRSVIPGLPQPPLFYSQQKCTFREFPANRENNREFRARHHTDRIKCFKFIGLAARSRQAIANREF